MSIENQNLRNDLINLIHSKNWSEEELRNEITNNLPELLNRNYFYFELAKEIDEYVFQSSGDYWGQAYNYPVIGEIIEDARVDWVGAFTIKISHL